jgi:hypothetical protein
METWCAGFCKTAFYRIRLDGRFLTNGSKSFSYIVFRALIQQTQNYTDLHRDPFVIR